MNQIPAKLMVAVFDGSVCIKINGRADFTLSVDLKTLITELWSRGYNRFSFELRDCTHMDSTFLGVLSGIGLKLSNGNPVQTGSPLVLLNPNPRLTETLEGLGVSDLFTIETCNEPISDKFEPLAEAPNKSQLELKRTCLEAHRALMEAHPDNVRKFKDVTQFLLEDLKRLEATHKP